MGATHSNARLQRANIHNTPALHLSNRRDEWRQTILPWPPACWGQTFSSCQNTQLPTSLEESPDKPTMERRRCLQQVTSRGGGKCVEWQLPVIAWGGLEGGRKIRWESQSLSLLSVLSTLLFFLHEDDSFKPLYRNGTIPVIVTTLIYRVFVLSITKKER